VVQLSCSSQYELPVGFADMESLEVTLPEHMPSNLMGVDVGFSTTRPTTGIACFDGDHLYLMRTGTSPLRSWIFHLGDVS
jgi:hypothetical protein